MPHHSLHVLDKITINETWIKANSLFKGSQYFFLPLEISACIGWTDKSQGILQPHTYSLKLLKVLFELIRPMWGRITHDYLVTVRVLAEDQRHTLARLILSFCDELSLGKRIDTPLPGL